MRIRLVAVGKGMPGWVAQGFHEYARRLPRSFSLELVEVRAGRRGRQTAAERTGQEEAVRLLEASGDADRRIALDENGPQWNTRELAARLGQWRTEFPRLDLLVGGADGLDPLVREKAQETWSLSRLTLPHMLVRVVVAEQVYRAWSILNNHPYHRD